MIDISKGVSYSGSFVATALGAGAVKGGLTSKSTLDPRYFVRQYSDGSSKTFWPVGVNGPFYGNFTEYPIQ